MKSGTVKHYNASKGYGFIDVDNLSKDVFFHISRWTSDSDPNIGQQVYVTIETNSKGQLRAAKVYSSPLDLSQAEHQDKFVKHPIKKHPIKNRLRVTETTTSQPPQTKKTGLLSTLFGLIIVAIVSYFGYSEFTDIPKDTASTHNNTATIISSSNPASSTNSQASYTAITGDAQIDKTIHLIQQDGPFPYPQKDGSVFSNFEGHLPKQVSGYYHEYTVPTPGISHRGARRIVTGGNPPTVYYLTLDHYDSFTRLDVE